MIRTLKITTVFSVLFLLIACGGSQKITQNKNKDRAKTNQKHGTLNPDQVLSKSEADLKAHTPEIGHEKDNNELDKKHFSSPTARYIYKFKDVAKQEMRKYGIPASITLAQGILESGAGQGKLTQKSNNHFGIKCHGWDGAKVYHDDDRLNECFRKYSKAKFSFRDHSLFLVNRSRYNFLFRYDVDNYKAWARGLKKAGYATDPAYPEKLISLVKRYDLARFDRQVMKSGGLDLVIPRKPVVQENTYTVKKGDTLYSISRKFGISVSRIKRLNNLDGNLINVGQVLKLK